MGDGIRAIDHGLAPVFRATLQITLDGGVAAGVRGDGIGPAFCRLRGGGEENPVRHLVGKLLLLHGANFDEGGKIIPDFPVALRFFSVKLGQAIPHLAGNESTDGAHLTVRLQGTAAHVEGQIRRIKHTLQGKQKGRHHLLDRVAHKHLVAIEANLTLVPLAILLQLREEQDAPQVVGVVGTEVYPQQWVPLEGIEITVKLSIILVLEFTGALPPWGLAAIHRVPLQLHGNGHEVAVGGNQLTDTAGLQIFQFLLLQMENHVGAWCAALTLLQLELGGAVTTPTDGAGARLGAEAP